MKNSKIYQEIDTRDFVITLFVLAIALTPMTIAIAFSVSKSDDQAKWFTRCHERCIQIEGAQTVAEVNGKCYCVFR